MQMKQMNQIFPEESLYKPVKLRLERTLLLALSSSPTTPLWRPLSCVSVMCQVRPHRLPLHLPTVISTLHKIGVANTMRCS